MVDCRASICARASTRLRQHARYSSTSPRIRRNLMPCNDSSGTLHTSHSHSHSALWHANTNVDLRANVTPSVPSAALSLPANSCVIEPEGSGFDTHACDVYAHVCAQSSSTHNISLTTIQTRIPYMFSHALQLLTTAHIYTQAHC